MIRKFLAAFAVMVLAVVGLTAATTASATVSEVCVPDPGQPAIETTYKQELVKAAWDESIPGAWQVWSPNNTQGPQDYTPDWPTDARGTWSDPKTEGGPDKDLTGTFNASNGNSGNSSWFHREAPTTLHHDAIYETVVDVQGQEYIAPTVCPDPDPSLVRVTFMCKATQDGPVLNTGTDQAFETGDYIFRIRHESGPATAWSAGVSGSVLPDFSGTIGPGEVEYLTTGSPVAGVKVTTSPEANLYNGTASTNETSCKYPAPSVVTEWHTWQTSLKPGVTTPEGGGDVTWPQTYVGAGQLVPKCGVWYQQDLYTGTRVAIDALYADGELVVLDNGKFEDHALVKDWEFVYGGDCPAPEPSVTFSHVVPTCESPGSVTVTTDDIPDSWWYGLRVHVDGVFVGPVVGPSGYSSVAVQGTGSSSLPLTFAEDFSGGSATVKYWVTDATEWDYVPPAMNNRATWPRPGDRFVEFEVDTNCLEEGEVLIPVEPAVYTAPTCTAAGTLIGVDTADYEWIRTGPDTAAVLTATAIGEVELTGTTVFGPHNLVKLPATDKACLYAAPVVPTVVKAATLAETGFPLLGLLGLAGSLSLIGGGLVNARRLLRKSA